MPPPSLREAIAPLKREIAERVAENAKLRDGGRLLPFRTIEPRQLHDADTLCDAMQHLRGLERLRVDRHRRLLRARRDRPRDRRAAEQRDERASS